MGWVRSEKFHWDTCANALENALAIYISICNNAQQGCGNCRDEAAAVAAVEAFVFENKRDEVTEGFSLLVHFIPTRLPSTIEPGAAESLLRSVAQPAHRG